MTEREFDLQRKCVDGVLKEARDARKFAIEREAFAHEWLTDLLHAANQEPWWGEAND